MKPPQNKKNKKTSSIDSELTMPTEAIEKPVDLQQKVDELNSLNTQLAANLFLRTTTLRIERDEATEKCQELKSQVVTLQGYVDRYATVNDKLLRDGSSKKSVVEDKERELLSKTQEIIRLKDMLSQETTRREELEDECLEMALQIKATERTNETLQRKVDDAERRAVAAAAKPVKPAPAPAVSPAVLSEMTSLKQKESQLTQSLKHTTDDLSTKTLELSRAHAALEDKLMERKIWIMFCVLMIFIHVLSHCSPDLLSLPFSMPSATKNLTSTVAMDVSRGVMHCIDPMQCTAQ